MGARVKGLLPLALTVAVLAFLYVEFTLNFSFHWVTAGDLGNGLELPKSFHLVTPVGFITWGLYFAAGAGKPGFQKAAIGSVFGCIAGLLLMILAPKTADLPDFWGISLWVLIIAFFVILLMALGDWYYVPAVFGAFASVVVWWIATGLDGWAKHGGGVGKSLKALGDPATAGAGAFGGVLSTPYGWVAVSILATLILGCIMGVLTSTISAAIIPKQKAEAAGTTQPHNTEAGQSEAHDG